MNNAERRRIVQEAKMNGYQGSYVDLFREAAQNPEGMQKPLFTAVTSDQKEQGLRPLHEAGRTDASMAFPDVPPNTPFNTVGMKAPIDIKKYDKQGHLVKSYENVPPGIQNLDTGPNVGTVLETPSRMQKGGFAPDNTRVSMPTLPTTIPLDTSALQPPPDQETIRQAGRAAPPNAMAFMPPGLQYNPLAAGKYIEENPHSNPVSLTTLGAFEALTLPALEVPKPLRAVKRYFQEAADEGRNAGIAFRKAQAQKEAVIRNERIAQKIDEGVDIGYDDIYKPIRAEFQQKLDMGYTNVRATPYGEISRSLQNRFAPLSKGPVNSFKGDINRFLDYDIPRQYRAEQNLFKRKLQRKADDALDEMIKFDRESGTYLNQIENLYRPSKGGSKGASISGPSSKEKLADDFFDRNLDAPGTVQNKRGGYLKLRRKSK